MAAKSSDILDNFSGSVIAASDVSVLQQSVEPWQLDMRQVTNGTMDARIRIGQVDDILVTREYWSQGVVASGKTPEGFLALSGCGSDKPFKWCGHEIDSRQLLCGLDSADVDFATPRSGNHWVVLIPVSTLLEYLGEGPVAALQGRRVLKSHSRLSNHLLNLADRAVQTNGYQTGMQLSEFTTRSLKAELLEGVARLIAANSEASRVTRAQHQFRICQQLIDYAMRIRRPIQVPELASQIDVGRRTVERAFRSTLGISPYRFLRLHRFNCLHHELSRASCRQSTVTSLLLDWGFSEPGRAAVEYRQLFGESPSATLADHPQRPNLRIADAIVN